MLQFAVLTAVILPLLPDRAFGPYGVLNPFQIWLMVVLVAAVSLSGYVAWRLTLGRHGLLLTGVLGGLVSSTATTLGYARQVAAGSQTLPAAVLVILLANATKLVRVLFLVAVVAPDALPRALVLLVPALLVSLAGVAWRWKAVDTAPASGEEAFATRRSWAPRSASARPTPWSCSSARGRTTCLGRAACSRWPRRRA